MRLPSQSPTTRPAPASTARALSPRRWSVPGSRAAASTPATATVAAPCRFRSTAGVTAWSGSRVGAGCAEPNFSGVYTRVAGPTMASLIQNDVSVLETTYGLDSSQSIFGTGGVPRYSAPPPPPAISTPVPPHSPPPDVSSPSSAAPTTQKANPYAKCKLARTKKKRRRCTQRIRRGLSA